MTKRDPIGLYTIGELAERAGLTRRTVRFYVQKGVLSPPDGAGRGARYSDLHLEQLEAIADAKRRNVTLDRVARSLEEAPSGASSRQMARPAAARSAEPEGERRAKIDASRWQRLSVAPGLELHALEDEFSAAERDALTAALSTALNHLRPDGRRANHRKRGE